MPLKWSWHGKRGKAAGSAAVGNAASSSETSLVFRNVAGVETSGYIEPNDTFRDLPGGIADLIPVHQSSQGQPGSLSPSLGAPGLPVSDSLLAPTLLAAGDYHAAMIGLNGGVFTCGIDLAALGRENGHTVPTPELLPSLSGIRCRTIAANVAHTLIGTADGGVYSCGTSGAALGHGDEEPQYEPRCLVTLGVRRVLQVAAGATHSLLLDSEGEVLSFGSGVYGKE